jgi:hypothetical protein
MAQRFYTPKCSLRQAAYPPLKESGMHTILKAAIGLSLILIAEPTFAQNEGGAAPNNQTAEVLSVDSASGITLKLSNGKTESLHPKDGLLVNGLRPGDRVLFTTTQDHGETRLESVTKQ